jgi:hypothetical protein
MNNHDKMIGGAELFRAGSEPEKSIREPEDIQPLASEESPYLLKKTIEQKPFRDLGVQQFFKRWCEANDHLVPLYVSREEWVEQQKVGVVVPAKGKDGKKGIKNVYIPKDLQLWEMLGVMDAIDRDTYANKPERSAEKNTELQKLGNTFKNAGVYIAQRLEGIDRGKIMAEALVQELYSYGDSILSGNAPKEFSKVEEIINHNLNSDDLENVDRWLAGENLYQARHQQVAVEMAKGVDADEATEKVRQRALRDFFRTSERAFNLKKAYAGNAESERPISSLHEAFLHKIKANLEIQIEKPRTELMSAAFRRGLELLYNEIKDPAGTNDWRNKVDAFFKKAGLDLKLSEQKLKDSLKIDEMKKELDQVRVSGDVEKISEKEREFAIRIQGKVSKLEYIEKISNPADAAALQKINCVGFTAVGMALQREVGLNLLVINQKYHASSFLITSNRRVYVDEMQGNHNFDEICDEDLKGSLPDGRLVTVEDLVQLSERKTGLQRITFEVIKPEVQKEYAFVYGTPGDKNSQPCIMSAHNADVGMQDSILSNLHNVISDNARLYETLGKENRSTYTVDSGFIPKPKAELSNDNLHAAAREANRMIYSVSEGQALKHRRFEKSKVVTKFGLEDLDEIEFVERATLEKRKSIIDQLVKAHDLRHMGYVEEAIEEYERFISMADPEKDKGVIVMVMKHINELKKND